MTSNDITFCFKKAPNSPLCCIDAMRGTTSVAVDRDKVTAVMTTIFDKLIKKDAAKYEKHILGLSRFSITVIHNPEHQSSLILESKDVVIHLRKLSKETAALFLNSIPTQVPQVISAKQPAQLTAETLDLKKETKQEPLKPVLVDVVANPSVQVVTHPSEKMTTATSFEPIVFTEPTEEEKMSGTIAALMVSQFQNTLIQHSTKSEEFFGSYLMNRVFEKPVSCHFDFKTFDFTLNFAQKKDIKLDKLPEGKSKEQLDTLKQLHGATLSIANQVKGKFNIEEGKLTFEPGCLTLNWRFSSAGLLGIFESRKTEGNVIMQINYLKANAQGLVSAQDFVDIIECNLPKSS